MLKLATPAFVIATAIVAQSQAPPAGADPELWARALRLHFDAVVVDTHSDTTSRILDERFDVGPRAKDGHMDLPRIAEGGLDVQFYSIYVASRYFGDEDFRSDAAIRASKPNGSAARALAMIDGFLRMVAQHEDRITFCTSVADIERAVGAGRHAALMGIEGGHAIEGDLALLRVFHQLGVRYMTLTHNNHNHFADCSGEPAPKWGGLNRLGVKVVLEMNRLGMLVDLSHVSDQTFADALAVTRAPVILSHSSCRALCGHRRNVTDEMLRALRRNGGVIMINFNCGFLSDDYARQVDARRATMRIREQAIHARWPDGGPELDRALAELRAQFPTAEPPPLDVLVAHIRHAVDVAGADHVGLGSDFDGVPCVPRGIDDVSKLPNLTYALLAAGLDEATVRKVLGANLLRVFRLAEQVALSLAAEAPRLTEPDDRSPQVRAR